MAQHSASGTIAAAKPPTDPPSARITGRRDAILLTTDYAPQLGGIAEYLAGLWREAATWGTPVIYSTIPAIARGATSVITLPPPPDRRLGERWGDGIGAMRRVNTLAHFAALRLYARRTVRMALAQLEDRSRVCVGVWNPLAHFWCEALAAAGQPYALIAHGLDVIQPMYPTVAPWRESDFRGAARVIANSAGTASMGAERLRLDPARIRVVNPGIDVSGYRAPPPQTLDRLRDKLELRDVQVILSVGRLVRRKGFDVALRAFAMHRAGVGRAKYVIAGDGPEREALEVLASELGVREHVRFMGTVDGPTKLALYELCDVFIMPNTLLNNVDWEGFGIVFLEAARAGKPSIGGANGGVPDAIAHRDSGLLVDPNDVEGVTAALTALLCDNELRMRLGAAARARAAQFDWPVIGERFNHVLEESW